MTDKPEWEIVPMTLEMAAEGNVLESKCFTVPTSENLLRTELLKPEAIYFAAVSEGKLVGYAGMQSVLDEGYMMDICVDPERRREGIARAGGADLQRAGKGPLRLAGLRAGGGPERLLHRSGRKRPAPDKILAKREKR